MTGINTAEILAQEFSNWFQSHGWQPREHQLDLLKKARSGQSTLLIAPTGAGKTLAGFLPALTALASRPKRRPGEAHRGIHTLYISPLKALAVDIKRNLEMPINEMGLNASISPSKPVPVIRPRAVASGKNSTRLIFCSPHRSNWRCYSQTRMQPDFFPTSPISCSTNYILW